MGSPDSSGVKVTANVPRACSTIPLSFQPMVWIKARIEVMHADLEREADFWTGVVGGPLPPHLTVQIPDPPWSYLGDLGVIVEMVGDAPVPPVPAPGSFPGVRRTRVYQMCLDIPHDNWDYDTSVWTRSTGGTLEVLERRPEFAWLRIPGGPLPLDLLAQRLDRS